MQLQQQQKYFFLEHDHKFCKYSLVNLRMKKSIILKSKFKSSSYKEHLFSSNFSLKFKSPSRTKIKRHLFFLKVLKNFDPFIFKIIKEVMKIVLMSNELI